MATKSSTFSDLYLPLRKYYARSTSDSPISRTRSFSKEAGSRFRSGVRTKRGESGLIGNFKIATRIEKTRGSENATVEVLPDH